jgi:hypothetical protein
VRERKKEEEEEEERRAQIHISRGGGGEGGLRTRSLPTYLAATAPTSSTPVRCTEARGCTREEKGGRQHERARRVASRAL